VGDGTIDLVASEVVRDVLVEQGQLRSGPHPWQQVPQRVDPVLAVRRELGSRDRADQQEQRKEQCDPGRPVHAP